MMINLSSCEPLAIAAKAEGASGTEQSAVR
jgi:hypothetical protein